MTHEQIEALQAAAQPLMDYLKENHHPHMTVIVTSDRAEMVEGVVSVVRKNARRKENSEERNAYNKLIELNNKVVEKGGGDFIRSLLKTYNVPGLRKLPLEHYDTVRELMTNWLLPRHLRTVQSGAGRSNCEKAVHISLGEDAPLPAGFIRQQCKECDCTVLQSLAPDHPGIAECVQCSHPNDIG